MASFHEKMDISGLNYNLGDTNYSGSFANEFISAAAFRVKGIYLHIDYALYAAPKGSFINHVDS